MRIKKHKNTNEYLLTASGHWVRNYTRTGCPAVDINRWTQAADYDRFLRHEIFNSAKLQNVDTEGFAHRKVVIVSDGLGFETSHKVLSRLSPKDVCVIAVNKALAKWSLVGSSCPEEDKRTIQYYVVNNPFPEAMSFLPKSHRYWPKCVASVRTYPYFTKAYEGHKYRYHPAVEEHYSTGQGDCLWRVDDYRNPICAAIVLAYRFGVHKLLLLSCEDVFEAERAGTIQIPNGRWIYPQQQTAHSLVDGCLHWLRRVGVSVATHGEGPEYENAAYIGLDSVGRFFKDDNE